MTQQAKFTPAFLSTKLKSTLLLIQWIGLMGGASVLISTNVWAAVETSADSPTDLFEETTSSPAPATEKSLAAAGTSADSSITAARKSTETVAQAPSSSGSSTPAVASQPSASTMTQPEVAPSSSTSASVSVEESATSSTDSTDYSDAYIDSTDYSIGATQTRSRSESNRPSVVLSERSTGCQAVLSAGQGVTGSLCGSRTRSESTKTAALSSNSITTTTRRLSQVVMPRSVASSVPITERSVRSSSQLRGWSNSAASSGNFSSVKIPKWFAPSNTRLIFPLAIPAAITSAFGWRPHPITGTWRFHTGTDLGAPVGTPVLAADSGKVAIADLLGGYGLAVVLNHNDGTQESLYGHLSEILVRPGEWVEQGNVIGLVGSTGNSTGSHLHFELRQSTPQGWVAVDPGQPLEAALAQLVRALQTAEVPSSHTGGT